MKHYQPPILIGIEGIKKQIRPNKSENHTRSLIKKIETKHFIIPNINDQSHVGMVVKNQSTYWSW